MEDPVVVTFTWKSLGSLIGGVATVLGVVFRVMWNSFTRQIQRSQARCDEDRKQLRELMQEVLDVSRTLLNKEESKHEKRK